MPRGLPIAAAAALALVAATPQPASADREAIVVLGAGVRADGQFGPRGTARLEATLDLARRRPDALIVVTGGAVTSRHPEGPLMADWLVARGVPRSRIRVEPRALHTGQNADYVVPILRRERIERATIVTDRNHVPRARFHFRAALREQGTRVKLRTHAVADGLRGKARVIRALGERKKIRRDRLSRARERGRTTLRDRARRARGGRGRAGR